MADWLKTADAAELAWVASSTIKRWADDGDLGCRRTPGGHRRYRREDLLAIISARDTDDEISRWTQLLIAGSAAELEAELRVAFRRTGSWLPVVEQVASALQRLGELWLTGQIGIATEHQASERLHRVLGGIADRMVVRETAVAALLCVSTEQHTLGLSLAELVLRDLGFEVVWLGANTPVKAVRRLLDEKRVDLVVASASSVVSPDLLEEFAVDLQRLGDRHDTTIVFAGSATWPATERARQIGRFAELEELARELQKP